MQRIGLWKEYNANYYYNSEFSMITFHNISTLNVNYLVKISGQTHERQMKIIFH
jgi:hypothetical protein